MLINLKKKKDKIDISVLVLIMFKLFLNLMDFKEVRFTQTAIQNMFYFGSLAFPLWTYQLLINTLMSFKFSFPMSIIVLIIIFLGELRLLNKDNLPMLDLFIQNQYTLISQFFQNFFALIFIWMILSFFKNQVIIILYQQTTILEETNFIL